MKKKRFEVKFNDLVENLL
jgi:hypothetical protein